MVTRLAAGATIVSVGRGAQRRPDRRGAASAAARTSSCACSSSRSRADRRPPRPAVRRSMHTIAADRAAGDGWAVAERRLRRLVDEASLESLFALVNGYMGVRGATDEANPGASPRGLCRRPVRRARGGRRGPGGDRPTGRTPRIEIDGPDVAAVGLAGAGSHRRTARPAAMVLERTCARRPRRTACCGSESRRLLSLAQPAPGRDPPAARCSRTGPAARVARPRRHPRGRERRGRCPTSRSWPPASAGRRRPAAHAHAGRPGGRRLGLVVADPHPAG